MDLSPLCRDGKDIFVSSCQYIMLNSSLVIWMLVMRNCEPYNVIFEPEHLFAILLLQNAILVHAMLVSNRESRKTCPFCPIGNNTIFLSVGSSIVLLVLYRQGYVYNIDGEPTRK
jgi:hypothetical protein